MDRSSWPILGALVAAALLVGWWQAWLLPVPAALLVFTAWFFRDPERTPPAERGVLLSPADGKIIRSGPDGISVFMNVLDVHVCRSPAGGRVASVRHTPGVFLAAFRDDASDRNERATVTLAASEGEVRFSLIAGLVARRIVCRVREGDRLEAGQRVGLIRFGSRVDVHLPPGVAPAVLVGDRVVAGETVIARFPPVR